MIERLLIHSALYWFMYLGVMLFTGLEVWWSAGFAFWGINMCCQAVIYTACRQP